MAHSKRPEPTAIGATQAPDGDLVELTRSDLDSGQAVEGRLRGLDLGEAKLRGLRIRDVEGEDVNAVNGDWRGAELNRVRFEGARLTGLDLGEARLEEVHFKGCKLDYANLRHAVVEHVTFEDCVLTNADFQGARVYASRFASCQLGAADFTKAELAHVDFRGSELALAGSVLGLGGATIDSLQLMDLSRTMAHELGIVVKEA
jgi:uncharacterized protein YjbI with pentapeptide repeats